MLSPRARQALVVGGGYAGVLAANRLAHRLPAGDALTLLTDDDALLDRIRLHEALARGRPARVPLERLLHPRVRLRRGRARALDGARRTVRTDEGDLPFDALLLAVGSRLSAPCPGVAAHAHGLRDEDAARGAFRRLCALPPGSPVVVLGGSLTALETAAEIAEAHPALRVTLAARSFAPTLAPEGAAAAQRVLDGLGVIVRAPTTCVGVTDDAVRLDDGTSLPAALAVWAGGFDAAGPALESDLRRDAQGRLCVRDDLSAPDLEGVFVAGDAAAPTAALPFLRMAARARCPWARPRPTTSRRGAADAPRRRTASRSGCSA
ncbi:MAG: FAD-dependent oxidoreductase [Polyangiales bacterium]